MKQRHQSSMGKKFSTQEFNSQKTYQMLEQNKGIFQYARTQNSPPIHSINLRNTRNRTTWVMRKQ